MWWRTLHSRNTEFFGFKVNEDGTISSQTTPELVVGFGLAADSRAMGYVKREWHYEDNKAIAGYDEVKKDEVKKDLDWSSVYLKGVDMGNRWIEIPYGEKSLYNALWFRTKENWRGHFVYTLNKDGTISPEENPEIVMGLADASSGERTQEVI